MPKLPTQKQSLLSTLRAQPEALRRRVAALISIAITLIIAVLWLVSLRAVAPLRAEQSEGIRPAGIRYHSARIAEGFTVLTRRVRLLLRGEQ